ncbi:MAG: hypothetical protein WDM92_06275 [Caulobacteraceae bacterium]
MDALAIANLITALAQALPAALQLASEFKATASAEDQATIDAAIAAYQATAMAHLAQAEADLASAAKA